MSAIDSRSYRAFISYSHKDEKWARWLQRSLETYRVPKRLVGQETRMGTVPRRVAPVFRGREELVRSPELGPELREALAQSATLIVICSPASATSHRVNEEILAFKRLGRSDRIFCLIVDGEPYASNTPGREDEECFPLALQYVLGDDGELTSTPAEPIAADARPGKDGRTPAKLKLIAGLLGVGFDALRQREQQRRQRRLAAVFTLSTVGMIVAIGLATTAILARNEAERQRARAASEAETARQTSSFLISLFEVSDPGEDRGRTITAREILTAGAARIDSELDGQPEVQTRLMTTIGRVYTGLGLYGDATELLDRAVTRRRRLEGISAAELAHSLSSLAFVKTRTAEFEEAEGLYRESIAQLREKGAVDSEEMGDALAGLAEVYYYLGRYDEAEPVLRQVLEHRERNLGPDDPAVADAIEELGLNQYDQGDLEGAETALRDALAQRRRALGAAPHPEIAENLNNLALVLLDLERFDESEALYREAMAMNQRLHGDSHPDVAMGLNNLGQLYRVRGRQEEAEQAFLAALAMNRELLGDTHPDLALVLHELAFLDYDRGRLQSAIDYTRSALMIQEAALGREHPEVAASLSRLGRWLSEAGAVAEAQQLLRESLALSRGLLDAGHPDVAIAEMGLAEVLTQSGDVDEALALATSATGKLAAAFGEDHWIAALGNSIRGGVLLRMGKLAEAEPLLTDSYAQLSAASGARPVYVRGALERVVALYETWGKTSLAGQYRTELAAIDLGQLGE